MEYKLENYLDRRDNTAKRGLVDGPGAYAGKPANPELAEKRKQKWIKDNPDLSWDDLKDSQRSRVYNGKETVGIGRGKNQPKTKNPESVKKMIETKTRSSFDDYTPEQQKNIKTYMETLGVDPENIEEEFFSYNKQKKSKIATGRLVGAPTDDTTYFSRIYKTETIPAYLQELDDEILRLTKEHSNPNKIKSELYKIFDDPKYTQVPKGVEAYNVFFDKKEKRFNFGIKGPNNRKKSNSFLNQTIAKNIMNSVEGDLNYDTAMAVKKFYLDKGDLTGPEKAKVKKFRRQYNLARVEAGRVMAEKFDKPIDSPWINYARNLKFNIGKRLTEFKKFETQMTFLENTIKTLTRPEDVRFFEKELAALKENQTKLIPAIRKEFPGLFDGIKINQEHKIAKTLVEEGTIPIRYLTKTTPTPSFFNAIKYKEFDEPLIELIYKYNDALPKDRPGIKKEIEDLQKNFNNKTKVKGVGYLDSVKFTFGPKGVRAKDTTPTFRKGDFGSQLKQNILHSNAYLKNTGKKSIVIGRSEGQTRYKIDKLIIKPPRNFEAAVQALGCRGTKVRLPRVEGGSIKTTKCYEKGLEKIKNRQVTDPVDARNMRNVAKASTMIARTGGAAKVAAILGPAGIGLDVLYEGAVIGNEVLKGKPFEEAWGRSFISYLGPNRQDPDELEMDRSAGDDPKAQSYVQDVRLENEFYKNFNLYKAMEANDMAYTRDEVLAQMEKTQGIYDQIANKYEDTADPKTDSLAQISKQTGSDGSMSVLNKDTNYRAFEKGQEREAALEGERSVNTTLFGIPINQMTPMKSDALRRQKITDIFEDGQLVGQKMKPEVQAQGMLNYNLLKSGAIPGIGYMAEGGLANLTRTTPPKRSLNKDSQGLASLPEYDR